MIGLYPRRIKTLSVLSLLAAATTVSVQLRPFSLDYMFTKNEKDNQKVEILYHKTDDAYQRENDSVPMDHFLSPSPSQGLCQSP